MAGAAVTNGEAAYVVCHTHTRIRDQAVYNFKHRRQSEQLHDPEIIRMTIRDLIPEARALHKAWLSLNRKDPDK
jgi:hypothetical protein